MSLKRKLKRKQMKLSTYPPRKLTDREITKVLGWIPILLIQRVGPMLAKDYITSFLLPLAGAKIPDVASLERFERIPPALAAAITGAIGSMVELQSSAAATDDYHPSSNPNQLEAAIRWILSKFDEYTALAHNLNQDINQQPPN